MADQRPHGGAIAAAHNYAGPSHHDRGCIRQYPGASYGADRICDSAGFAEHVSARAPRTDCMARYPGRRVMDGVRARGYALQWRRAAASANGDLGTLRSEEHTSE